ncbi:MAG TPA: VIT1/CCC1 transporter family protein [Burkholderiales bacterium]|nr:VIT1/CCC1 transporter family protein [Burkholderiales bacterium]
MATEAAEQRRQAISVQSGAARAAVLGVSDGLVTNVSLILGVVGATANPEFVRIAGLASLVAGACSMAVGEYISMRAQVELLCRLLLNEREAMRDDPSHERKVLERTLKSRGIDARTARTVSAELARNPKTALASYAREVLGIDPDELGSPWASAISSLLTFALGAFIPLIAWLVAADSRPIMTSLALSAIGALTVGGVLGYLADRRIWRFAFRQLLLVVLASGITFLVGRLLGTMVT